LVCVDEKFLVGLAQAVVLKFTKFANLFLLAGLCSFLFRVRLKILNQFLFLDFLSLSFLDCIARIGERVDLVIIIRVLESVFFERDRVASLRKLSFWPDLRTYAFDTLMDVTLIILGRRYRCTRIRPCRLYGPFQFTGALFAEIETSHCKI